MHSVPIADLPKWVLQTLNNVYDMERKLSVHGDPGNLRRNIERIKEAFESEKVFYDDPMGETFNETRTDLEASITGTGADDLVVVEVIKPIVRFGERALSRVVQKGIVIVKSKAGGES
jgi:hypothetical protein